MVLDLWVFFTDHQLVFRASSLPHGHLGRPAADHEEELGLQGEAVPVKGAVCSMVVVWEWGVDGCGALAVVLQTRQNYLNFALFLQLLL